LWVRTSVASTNPTNQELLMSVSTAVIANVVLDVAALGTLALVCRVPFLRALQRVTAVTTAQVELVEYEQQRAA
jgi:hypothetical protein